MSMVAGMVSRGEAEQSIGRRERPKTFRALGTSEPPLLVTVDGDTYQRVDIFKHDSWAATALYSSPCGSKIVCKFNRVSSVGFIPMRWLGRLLAKREHSFLSELQGVTGIPKVYSSICVLEKKLTNAVAHDFVEGKPLSIECTAPRGFFDRVEKLLQELHDRHIAYIDLHKQENVIVGDDGNPYLIDFQVSLRAPRGRLGEMLMTVLRDFDLYNVHKHRRIHRQPPQDQQYRERPMWLNAHRMIAVPFRKLRRKFLVWIGVRAGKGTVDTERAPELGLRRAKAA